MLKVKKIILIMGLLINNPLFAEDKNNDAFTIPDIIVQSYGQVFEQKFKDIPGSMNIYKNDYIQNRNITSLFELAQKVPGISYSIAGMNLSLNIRGTNKTYVASEMKENFALVVDNILVPTFEAKNPLLMSNIEQVEILKGPQQILYGNDARAGLVNIIHKKPTKSSGAINIGIANNKSNSYSLYYNHIFNDIFSLGFSVSKEKTGNYVKHLPLNKKTGGEERKNYSFTLSFNPSLNDSILINYYKNNDFSFFPSVAFDEEMNPRAHNFPIPFDINIPFIGFNFPRMGRKLNIDDFEVNNRIENYYKIKSEGLALKYTHEFTDKLFFTYVFSKNKLDSSSYLDMFSSNIAISKILDAAYINKINSTTHDLRLNFQDKYVDAIVGVNSRKINRVGGFPIVLFKKININSIDNNSSERNNAFYTLVKIKPVDKFSLSLGYRHLSDKLHANTPIASDNKIITKLMSLMPQKPLANELSSVQNLYSITAQWTITPTLKTYTTMSKTYLPGGRLNSMTGPSNYKPETGVTKEIGFSYHLPNERFFINSAFYKGKFNDYQVLNPVTQAVDNLGKVDLTGYEFALNLKITPNLLLTVGQSYASPEMKNVVFEKPSQFAMAKSIPIVGKQLAKSGKLDPTIIDYSGKKAPWVRFHTTNVDLTLKTNAPYNKGDLLWNVSFRREGKGFTWFDNTIPFKTMKTIDASVAYEYKNHKVVVWGKNLTNKHYVAYGFSVMGINTGYYNKGRTFGLNYEFKF